MASQQRNALVSVFGFQPVRISAGEVFVREVSLALERRGWQHVVCFMSEPQGAVREFLALPNVTFDAVPDAWKLAWAPARDLHRILQRHRPKLLHLSFTGLISPYPWLGRLNGVKRILFTDQGSRPEGFVPRRAPAWRRAMTRLINLPLDHVISISNYVRSCWAIADLLPAARVTRIYNSVDLTCAARGDGDAFRRRFSIPGDRLVAVQVAWVIPEKGFADLLEAARIVVRQNPRAHFLFVGEGERRAEYTRKTAELGLEDHVTWTGPLLSPLEEGAYAAAQVACQVSRWEEGFGWVIAEAMSSALPVVGTRVGAIPELIEDGRTGFLVDRGDHQAMAGRLLELFADAELRRRLGCAARREAESRFDLRANVASLMELYGLGTAS